MSLFYLAFILFNNQEKEYFQYSNVDIETGL